MQQITHNLRSGKINLLHVPNAVTKPGYVLVKNNFSVVSIGTEMMKVRAGEKSLVGKAKERPDQVKQVMEHMKQKGIRDTYKRVMNRLDRMTPLGYSSSGVVVEVGDGITELKVGDRVACGGCGHAELITVPKHLCALIPPNVKMEDAAFSTLGAIALHGMHQAETKLCENIVVIGLGLIGQILVRLLGAAGCNVIGIDINDRKLSIAEKGGVNLSVNRNDDRITDKIRFFTNGIGADAVILTAGTSNNDPIDFTPHILRDRGKLVVLGIAKMDIPWRTYYEKEIDIKLSRSYGPGRYDPIYEERGIDYPVGYVRWTQQRNMTAFLSLLSKNKININQILTHKFPFREAEGVYRKLNDENGNDALGVLFEYGDVKKDIATEKQSSKPRERSQYINIGMIGAGNYARNTILPLIKSNPHIQLHSIVTETSLSSKDAQLKYGFANSLTDADMLFKNPEINTIIVATRHDTHAKFVIESLKANKHVFVEKPLSLNFIDLEEIEKCYDLSNAILMVGYNRRFSIYVEKVCDFFRGIDAPLALNYRINAGSIANDHWYQDPVKGGGRIIGECCHFVDVLQYITKEEPIRVFAETFSTENKIFNNNDTVNINIKFSKGSIATLNYFSCGDVAYSKERLEVMGGNSIAVVDDYKSLELIKNGKRQIDKNRTQDKGHKAEFQTFFNAVNNGDCNALIPFHSLKMTTLTTLSAIESLKRGIPISL